MEEITENWIRLCCNLSKMVNIQPPDYNYSQSESGIDTGGCFKLDISNNSINLRSDILALSAANLWYSSKMEVKHHFWYFLKHPTRQPVRCCTWKFSTWEESQHERRRKMVNEYNISTFPRLQWIKRGLLFSSTKKHSKAVCLRQ